MKSNSLKSTYIRDGMYCVKKVISKKLTYVPINPQPTEIVTIHHYYTKLTGSESFKKYTSIFVGLPENLKHKQHITIVENNGQNNKPKVPHGKFQSNCHTLELTQPC